jgi:hypothetical protein
VRRAPRRLSIRLQETAPRRRHAPERLPPLAVGRQWGAYDVPAQERLLTEGGPDLNAPDYATDWAKW